MTQAPLERFTALGEAVTVTVFNDPKTLNPQDLDKTIAIARLDLCEDNMPQNFKTELEDWLEAAHHERTKRTARILAHARNTRI
jgi:hypothetical protein